jgi:hypothetical protein
MVLDRIREATLKWILEICTFAAREVAYLGHLVSGNGVSPDADKVEVVKLFPFPMKVRDIRSFLRLAGYYRSFIPNFAALSKPLTQLTLKEAKFWESEPQQISFDALEEALTSDSAFHTQLRCLYLRLFRHTSPGTCVGVENQEVNCSTTEKELLPVVFGVQTHRWFLYGRRFKIITDHSALKWLITVKNNQLAILTKWVLKPAEYVFDVMHRPDRKLVNSDVLSRHVAAAVRNHDNPHDIRHGRSTARWSAAFKGSYQASASQQTKQALSEGKVLPYFLDKDSVLYLESTDASGEPKSVVPVSLREQVIQQHHVPVFAGHQGEKVILCSLRLH